jgi:predicted AAA+ superfamily ATPase
MKEILSRLESHNPWWQVPEVIGQDSLLREFASQKYQYYHPLLADYPIEEDGVITLRGPRRVGKSTLVKLILRKLLLEFKVLPKAVFFFACDTVKDYVELEGMLNAYLEFARPRVGEQRLFGFLDEISFVEEWQRAIKLLWDQGKLKNSTWLITGSNVLDVKFSSERLAGRRGSIKEPDRTILPLLFDDYVRLVEPELAKLTLAELKLKLNVLYKALEDYLITGGFPQTINEYHLKGYIPTSTYEAMIAWIEGDLHKINRSEVTAAALVKRAFAHLTSTFSWYKLAKEAETPSYLTVKDYIEIMQKMFLIIVLQQYAIPEKQVKLKKNKKIYFTDPFIYNCMSAWVNQFMDQPFNYVKKQLVVESEMDKLAENLVAAKLERQPGQLYYGRQGEQEIDFVVHWAGKLELCEVKYRKRVEIPRGGEKQFASGLTIITRENWEDNTNKLRPLPLWLMA